MESPDSPPVSSHLTDYSKAALYLENKRFVKAIVRAKYNLLDLLLPPYWQIRNCIIVCSAEDDWDEAQVRTFSFPSHHRATQREGSAPKTDIHGQRYLDAAEEIWQAKPNDPFLPPFRAQLDALKTHQDNERARCKGNPVGNNESELRGTDSPPSKISNGTGSPVSKVSPGPKEGELRLEAVDEEGEVESKQNEEPEDDERDKFEDEDEDEDIDVVLRNRSMEPDAISAIRRALAPGTLLDTIGPGVPVQAGQQQEVSEEKV